MVSSPRASVNLGIKEKKDRYWDDINSRRPVVPYCLRALTERHWLVLIGLNARITCSSQAVDPHRAAVACLRVRPTDRLLKYKAQMTICSEGLSLPSWALGSAPAPAVLPPTHSRISWPLGNLTWCPEWLAVLSAVTCASLFPSLSQNQRQIQKFVRRPKVTN